MVDGIILLTLKFTRANLLYQKLRNLKNQKRMKRPNNLLMKMNK